VIFCSIDDKNQAYVKGLFDEVFGESNQEIMIWKKIGDGDAGAGKMKTVNRFRVDHEYVLCVFKNKDNVFFNRLSQKPDFKNKGINPDNDPRGVYKTGNMSKTEVISSIKGKNYYTVASPSGKKFSRQWHFDQNEFDRLNHDNRIYWGKNGDAVPSIKIFLNEEREVVVNSILENVGSATSASKEMKEIFDTEISLFSNPKPVQLIQRLMKFVTKDDLFATILDFFAGSGTTGQAVLELNKQDGGERQFILATANEITDTTPNGIVNDVTSKRLKRVMTGECYGGTKDFKWNKKNKPLGDNLDVYDIATVAPYSNEPFEKIDETLYGQEKLGVKEKIKWVCENFEGTQKTLEVE